jgi:MFS family permease
MGGLLFGGFISGQIADTYGRKLTYYLGTYLNPINQGNVTTAVAICINIQL